MTVHREGPPPPPTGDLQWREGYWSELCSFPSHPPPIQFTSASTTSPSLSSLPLSFTLIHICAASFLFSVRTRTRLGPQTQANRDRTFPVAR